MKSKRFYKLFKKSTFSKKLYPVLGFYPKNEALYIQAFAHKSADEIKTKLESNERLEFLGDAVLGQIIANFLFKKYPNKDEGELTKIRSKLVNRKVLNQVGVKLGIPSLLSSNVETYSKSIYGDALEALIGAIYLDKGYQKTEQFVVNRLLKIHLNLEDVINTEIDFKSKLIELAQKEKWEIKFNHLEAGPDNKKTYTATLNINGKDQSTGTASTKKQAEQKAAQKYFENTNK
ncbi:MAG: hypothetical protein Kow0079_10230 [Vicingaceae bacterium]